MARSQPRARRDDPPSSEQVRARPLATRGAEAAPVLVGLALGWLVGHDGSPLWRLLRMGAVGLLVLAWRAGRSRPRPRRAVVVGWLLTAVGLGFLPHLVTHGLTPTGVSALVVAVGGLAALVVGVRAVAAGGRRRLGAAVGAVAGALAVGLVVSPAVLATNVPRPALGAGPASVGLDAEAVVVPTADGVALHAWYVPSDDGAAVVLRHGSGSTRSSVLRHAAVLAAHGYGVLLVDARGHGESEGRAMGFGWYGELDVAAAVDHLVSRSDVDPARIGVVGLSMGGEECIGASGADPRIRAVVAEGATARTAGDEAWLPDVFGLRGTVQVQLERLQDAVTRLLTDAPQPRSNRAAVARSSARYLLVAGGAVPDEVHTARDLQARAPDRVEVWVVPGAGHTAGLRTAPEAWEARVVGFLDEVLGA